VGSERCIRDRWAPPRTARRGERAAEPPRDRTARWSRPPATRPRGPGAPLTRAVDPSAPEALAREAQLRHDSRSHARATRGRPRNGSPRVDGSVRMSRSARTRCGSSLSRLRRHRVFAARPATSRSSRDEWSRAASARGSGRPPVRQRGRRGAARPHMRARTRRRCRPPRDDAWRGPRALPDWGGTRRVPSATRRRYCLRGSGRAGDSPAAGLTCRVPRSEARGGKVHRRAETHA